MKRRNKNFPVKTECCKQIAKCYRLCISASCECLLAIVPAHATPQLSELGNKSCLQLANMDSMKSVLRRLLTHCSIEVRGHTESSFCGMSSFLTGLSQFCTAKAFGGCFQPSTLGICPGVLVRSHAYCIAELLSLRS